MSTSQVGSEPSSGLEVDQNPTSYQRVNMYSNTDGQAPGYHSAYATQAESEKRTNRRSGAAPCSLSAIAFAALASLVTGIIIGAAVGGGLGGSLAHEKIRNNALQAATSSLAQKAASTIYLPNPTASTASAISSSASPTASSALTNYVVASPEDISNLALDCPNMPPQYSTVRGQLFNTYCGLGLSGSDLASILVYAFDDCVEACSSINYWFGNATLCSAVEFTANIDIYYTIQHVNCWLKYAASNPTNDNPNDAGAIIANNGTTSR